jgi:hypothetical protein
MDADAFAAHPAVRKRLQVNWITLKKVSGMDEAKRILLTWHDPGALHVPEWNTKWKSKAGGDKHRRVYQCCAHMDCDALVRLVEHVDGVAIQLNGAEHKTVPNVYDRKNAQLTRSEKAEMQQAKSYGGTPATVVARLSNTLVQSGRPVQKRAKNDNNGVGLKGAQLPPRRPFTLCYHMRASIYNA